MSTNLKVTHDCWQVIETDCEACCAKYIMLLNMLSRLVITFLPKSKRLLISWLQSPSATADGAPKDKV